MKHRHLRRLYMPHAIMTSLLLVCSVQALAATVHVSNPDGALGKAKVEDSSNLVGLVGDFVDLDPGEHLLRIEAPRGYTLLVKLHVSNDNIVTITESEAEPGNCKPKFETTWEAPGIVTNARKPHKSESGSAPEVAPPVVYTLNINTPQFGASSKSGSCALPMMLGCTKSMAIVAVDSTPPGAEVWIDNERMSVATKATLSVPFCPGREKTKQVLIRMPGRVTCRREVPVDSGVQTNVACDLRPTQ